MNDKLKHAPLFVNKAYLIAQEAHEGQKRRNGDPYFTHPVRVAESMIEEFMSETDWMHVAAGYLHDVIEDCGYTKERLIEEGMPPLVALVVDTVSRKEGETYLDFILRIKKLNNAVAVKIADIRDNLSDLNKGSLRDKYQMALYILGKTSP